ncbi:MAG TPA: hypothetical protein VG708_02550 [Mycobacteriales bacterium]|jgi:hypothetical protein|nr:hypothetical protein [Mycobacteriales bacterium]
MHRVRAVRWLAVAAGTIALTATACTHTKVTPGPTTTVTTKVTKPGPTKTRIRNYPVLAIGKGATLTASSGGAALSITAGKPSLSTTRLSSSYGYGPEHGHYVTFPLTISDTGRTLIVIERLDFYVEIQGQGKVTTDDGAAPFSGAPTQLDTTQLSPGQRLSNKKLTFDVSHTHGTLYYAPGGHRSIAWRF